MALTSFPIPTTPLAAAPNAMPTRSAGLLGHATDGTLQHYPLSAVTNSYDLRHFGVVANGTTDDSAALQAAFNAIPAGSVVDFPQGGTILLRSYVNIPVDHLTIRGNGCKIISDASGQDRKFLISGRTGIKFSGLKVDGGEHTLVPFTGIYDTYSPNNQPGTFHFLAATDCSVKECSFAGVNWPVTILGLCSGITVDHCRFSRYYTAVYAYFLGTDSSGSDSPEKLEITNNRFYAGLHPVWPNDPEGGPRTYTLDDCWCTGAIKFRGAANQFRASQNLVMGNKIIAPGQMGIETQGNLNDCAIIGNFIDSASIGISLSYTQRASVVGNTIKNFLYTGIESDGNNSIGSSHPGNRDISMVGNIIDGRDLYGRPANFYNNFGIVVTNRQSNIVISGGSIDYCKNGIGIFNGANNLFPENITISSVSISSNEESGLGSPLGSDSFVSGIFVNKAKNVSIIGCKLRPSGSAYQRMILLDYCDTVDVKACKIESNNCPIYIKNSSNINVCLNTLQNLQSLGTSPSSYVAIDSLEANCETINVSNNILIGPVDYGLSMYAPANAILGVKIYGNDTSRVVINTGGSLFAKTVSGTGSISVDVREQMGASLTVDGNAGPYTDNELFETLFCLYTATVNLQTAVGQSGKKKTIVCLSTYSTVTIHPMAGQTINGSSANLTLTNQWDRLTLQSDGSNWVVIDASPSLNFPIGDAIATKTLKVNGGTAGTAIRQITTRRFTVDFGTIAAGGEFNTTLAVPCGTGIANKPSAIFSWVGYVPSPITCRQCYVQDYDSVSLRVYNPGSAAVSVGSQTFSITVIEFAE